MSRRIDIELTSARPDGTWTWRAAGAQKPKGVLDGTILPEGAKSGDVLKVDADMEVEGITILGVVGGARSRKEPTRLELLPAERSFEPVTQTLAKRAPGDRPRRDGERPRRDGPGGDRDRPRGPRPEGGDRPRGPRPEGAGAPSGDRARRDRPARPRFEPVPEVPQRPRPKRLKPGKAHRSAVLAELPEAQRAIAEKALSGGIPAVRQAVNDQNASLRAEGKEEVPAAGLLKMAEELLPRLRVAEWLDRADAAKADLADLDLRDLRSVVAAGDEPSVARDESTRALAAELKAALVSKQEKASAEWLEDIQLALSVGRVIRALKLSAEPPKAGMRFPAELAAQLAAATTAALSADATSDRWSALLEAVAFSPVRAGVAPAAPPATVTDELTGTVKRLAVLIPQIAGLFGIASAPNGPAPKPLRPTRAKPDRKPGAPAGAPPAPRGTAPRPPAPPRPAPAPAPAAEAPAAEAPAAEAPAVDTGAADTASDVTAPADSTPADPTPADPTPADTTPGGTTPAESVATSEPSPAAEVAAPAEAETPAAAAPAADEVEPATEAPVADESPVAEPEVAAATPEAATAPDAPSED